MPFSFIAQYAHTFNLCIIYTYIGFYKYSLSRFTSVRGGAAYKMQTLKFIVFNTKCIVPHNVLVLSIRKFKRCDIFVSYLIFCDIEHATFTLSNFIVIESLWCVLYNIYGYAHLLFKFNYFWTKLYGENRKIYFIGMNFTIGNRENFLHG